MPGTPAHPVTLGDLLVEYPIRSEFRTLNGNVGCNLCWATGGQTWGDLHALELHYGCPICEKFFTHPRAHISRKHQWEATWV